MNPRDGSTVTGKHTKGLLRNGVVAQVSRYYVTGHQARIDCFQPLTPNQWRGVPVLGYFGAGAEHRPVGADGAGQTALSATPNGAAQAVLFFIDSHLQPVCVGFLAAAGVVQPARNTGDGAEDASPDVAETDHATTYGGAARIIDKDGNLIDDTTRVPTEGAGNIRHQLRKGAVERISREGEAGDAAVLTKALLAYCLKLETKFLALEALVKTIPPSAPALVTYELVPMPMASTAKLASAVLKLSSEGE